MGAIAYSVTAELPDEPTRERYIQWLESGHVRGVVEAGALSGEVIRIDEPGEPRRVVTRYIFADRSRLEVYLRDHAPALRADGLARFGPETGVAFSRSVGELVFRSERPGG
jgi:hypothetical protein